MSKVSVSIKADFDGACLKKLLDFLFQSGVTVECEPQQTYAIGFSSPPSEQEEEPSERFKTTRKRSAKRSKRTSQEPINSGGGDAK